MLINYMETLWWNFSQLKYLIGLILKNLDKYLDNSPVGCFLEVDLDYTEKLHDFDNDNPLASKKIKLTKEM